MVDKLADPTEDPKIVTFTSLRPYREKAGKDLAAEDIEAIADQLKQTNEAMYDLAKRCGWVPKNA